MITRFKRCLPALIALAGLTTVGTPSAQAITLTLSESGFATQTFTGLDVVTTGIISYGTFSLVVETGTSNGPGGNPAFVTINNLAVSSSIGGTLTINVSDNFNSSSAGTAAVAQQLSVTSLTAGSTVSEMSLVNGLAVPGTTATLSGLGAVATSGTASIGGNFSLSNVTTVILGAGGEVQSTGNTTATITAVAVPEPGTLAMAALAVPLLGFGLLRRRRAKV